MIQRKLKLLQLLQPAPQWHIILITSQYIHAISHSHQKMVWGISSTNVSMWSDKLPSLSNKWFIDDEIKWNPHWHITPFNSYCSETSPCWFNKIIPLKENEQYLHVRSTQTFHMAKINGVYTWWNKFKGSFIHIIKGKGKIQHLCSVLLILITICLCRVATQEEQIKLVWNVSSSER